MGTWGAENFANDNALDWLRSAIERPLIETIEMNLRDQNEVNDQVIMAAVEVLAVLSEQLRAVPPEPEKIIGWRDSYLRAWDSYIDSLSPKDDYKRERREVIVTTFGRLLAAANAWHAVPLRIDFEEDLSDQEREQLRHQLHAALVAVGAGELTGGETFAQPDENDILTIVTGRAFVRDAACDILRRALRSFNVDSARWICFGEPIDEFAEVWVTPDPPE
jgi:hypothetical protein